MGQERDDNVRDLFDRTCSGQPFPTSVVGAEGGAITMAAELRKARPN